MSFVECANGHLYDPAQYASCPYCNGAGNRIDFTNGPVMDEIGRTAPVSGVQPESDNIGHTVAPKAYIKEQEEAGKTVGIFAKNISNDPVVGWLVCIEGAEKGKDHRIFAKNNTIGRSEAMDICIKGDNTISRENHARLSYDGKHNNFHLIPAESTNNIYLNDEPVYVPTVLAAYDMIEFGDTKLLFVPFCCDRFKWEA